MISLLGSTIHLVISVAEGWGKKLNYCVAFSADEAVDVTKRYTRNWQEVLKRRVLVDEEKLKQFLDQITHERQKNLPEERREILKERRKREEKELDDAFKRTVVKDSERMGRQTGSIEWRTARGESGNLDIQAVASASRENDGMIRLTTADPDQVGAAYCSEQLDLSQTNAAVFEFGFRITNKQGEAAWDGADGFAFVIQSAGPTALGQGGCELGYGGLKNSVAIEFDTYKSADRCDDPSGNHISLHTAIPPQPISAHQKYSLGHTSRIPAMNSGKWIYARISIFVDEKLVDVSLKEDDEEADDYVSVLAVNNVDLAMYLNGNSKAWIGFTASTGGLSQNQDIRWKRAVVYRK
ncbi:concanavalin A-like lectin/glucanase domain-containing protein [Zychaea mexicana]|uniref:concanavalin A-like lectin/glucanase domain-containing protein n=1 Tax=Zychaea mexicana TaxID=64656 RepID=UPI0022FE4A10|nr:concanavalin A-like lectin/glucanase domain-containing protein [Zychaea mexicana]KAI9488329.1 concanavalin A-like lectin/glucanase domain-containing protein [Zychaea mexicana]